MNILLTICVFLLSLLNLWLWSRVTDLENVVHLIAEIMINEHKKMGIKGK